MRCLLYQNFSLRARRYVASKRFMRAAALNSYVGVKVSLVLLVNVSDSK